MKRLAILLLLVTHSGGNKVKRHFLNEKNNSTDESFQVNVSAIYGVHPETVNQTSSVSPVYQFQDRKEVRSQDQTMTASRILPEVVPSPTYQVHEKTPEIQEKQFQVSKNHKHRSVEKKVRPTLKEIQKVVNNLEQKPGKLAGSGPRIVEVLKVPAVYELHLQADPQRMVSINPQLANKLSGLIGQKFQVKRPVLQDKNFAHHSHFINHGPSFNQPQNLKAKFLGQRNNYNQPIARPSFEFNHPRTYQSSNIKVNQNYPSSYQNIQTSPVSTEVPKLTTQGSLPLYPPLSNEIPNNYYQKPQALHEVPAPILHKPYKQILPKTKPTPVPTLVYGKPAATATFKPHTESPVPAPGAWGNNIQDSGSWEGSVQQASYGNNIEQGSYQPLKPQVDLTYQGYQQSAISPPNTGGTYPYYQNQQNHNGYGQDNNIHAYYKGQNYYNEAFSDYLDQSLVNINGELSTYINDDGTMTISNFHQNPKSYKASMDYVIPVTESSLDFAPQGFDFAAYATQQADLSQPTSYNNLGYGAQISGDDFSDRLETQSQGFSDQRHDLNALLDETQKQKFEPMGVYERAPVNRRMIERPYFRANRRMYEPRTEPVDYIFYIKEKTFD